MIVEKVIEVSDLAYAAGLMDGEGSVSIYRRPPRRAKGRTSKGDRSPRYEVSLQLGMTNASPVYWLKDTFGGSAFPIHAIKAGNRPAWGWRLGGERASTMLKALLPHLKVKALQAMIAIHFQDCLIRKGGWNGERISKSTVELRDRFSEMVRMLNSGYDPEVQGGYGDN